MQTFQADLAIVGAGGAGLRAAIAAAQANPNAKIALISKVYPMRSHTVAAEGGSAAVAQDHDSFEYHFHDTVAGGDWLCEQDVVDYFVHHCPTEMTQLELWGCPWSRRPDGSVNVRRFGGMKIERTWFAADKTGFHMLHTLFQTSLQFPQIQRFDEHFVLDILVDDGHVRGLVAMNMMEGTLVQIRANAVVMATGGAGRVYRYNTNGGIVTGDGMGMALSHGVPLRDMEFVQYHPTGLPGSGILMTEGCRGEGGILVNKNGYRYLQDYGMGPETPLGEPKNKYMELGPRDKVSQAFWHEWRKGNTISTPRGDVVYLDLRHLGEKKLHERLPFICELAKAYVGVDPVKEPIPVRPTAHYTMGGIETDQNCETRIKGLFAVGECSSVGLHGANRLGSTSLAELVVFGRLAGEQATERAATAGNGIGTWSSSFGEQIDVVVSNNDGMGMSMFNAWSKDNKVPTFGYDANSDAVAAIAEGYGGTISQHADVQAYLTLRVLRNALDGVDINTGISIADDAGNVLSDDVFVYKADERSYYALNVAVTSDNYQDFMDSTVTYAPVSNQLDAGAHPEKSVWLNIYNSSDNFLGSTYQPLLQKYDKLLNLKVEYIGGDGQTESNITNRLGNPSQYDAFAINMVKTDNAASYTSLLDQ